MHNRCEQSIEEQLHNLQELHDYHHSLPRDGSILSILSSISVKLF